MTRHKYGARPVDGYASTLERDRARELRLLEHAGEIRDLVEQPRVELLPGVRYTADFAYDERPPSGPGQGLGQWRRIHEEAKGVDHFKKGFGGSTVEYLGEWDWAPYEWLRRAANIAIARRFS